MIKSILFLVEAPFNQRDYKRFGVELFIREGFDVNVWDLTPFLYPDAHASANPPDPVQFKNLIHFKHRRDAITALNTQGHNVFVINLLSYNIGTFEIFLALSKNNLPYAWLTNDALALPAEESKGYIKSLIRRMSALTIASFINSLLIRIPVHFLKVKPATFILAGGAKSISRTTLIASETKIIWIHAFDYDSFLDEPNGSVGESNLAVFLDQYFPFHPDTHSGGERPVTSPEDYYPALCRFFDHLEKQYDVEVVIAAHPRSHYEKHPDVFGKRRIVRGKTAELVKNSRLVIVHGSTAMNSSLLYRKPIMFITTDSFEKAVYGRRWKYRASLFGKVPINISRAINIDFGKELVVDEEAYDKYINDYIKVKESENLPFWQIVCSEIRKYSASRAITRTKQIGSTAIGLPRR